MTTARIDREIVAEMEAIKAAMVELPAAAESSHRHAFLKGKYVGLEIALQKLRQAVKVDDED